MMKGDTFDTPLGRGGNKGVRVKYIARKGDTFKGCSGRVYKYNPRYGYSVNWTSMLKKSPNNLLKGVWEFFGEEELKLLTKAKAKGR